MQKTFFVVMALVICVILPACSGYIKTSPGTEVEVSGSVNGPDGKPLSDCSIFFQPTGGNAQPAQFTLKKGEFNGKMLSGKYTFYLEASTLPGSDIRKAEAALKGVPAAWRSGSLERQIDVSGGKIEIKF